MLYILWAILILLCAFIAIVLIRTLRFKPTAGLTPTLLEGEEVFDKDGAVSSLQALVRCKTISNSDPSLEDDGEFEKLIDLLPQLYPNVWKTCEFRRMPDRGLLFHWKGQKGGDPAVLMAHYDVVSVVEEDWEKPAFEGIIENGVLWGRGAIDISNECTV